VADCGAQCTIDWFDRARAAMDWWTTQPQTEPTSSLTGGGAIAALERVLGERLGGWALALPSGSSAVRAGLRALGRGADDTVELVGDNWFGSNALIRSVGACESSIGPKRSVRLSCWSEVATPSSESAVLIDAANVPPNRYKALARLDWDGVALSLGPGKPIDVGEGGVVVMRRRADHLRAVQLTQHPIRQALNGIVDVRLDVVCERIHPMAALVALHLLTTTAAPVHACALDGGSSA